MADKVQQVAHFFASVPNQVGEGARVLGALKDHGVNLIAVWGYPIGPDAQFEMVTDKPEALAKAAKKVGLKLGPKQESLYITGKDRAGAMAGIFAALAAEGISVGAAQAVSSGDGKFGAVVFLPRAALRKARTILEG